MHISGTRVQMQAVQDGAGSTVASRREPDRGKDVCVPARPRRQARTWTAALAVLALLAVAAPARSQSTAAYVLGGPAAMPSWTVDDVAGAVGGTPERLAGSNRFATAVAISRHAFPSSGPDTVYLASGRAFPDALAAAPAVAANDAALLLTEPTTLPSTIAAELDRLQPDRVYVLGGPNAVADAVLQAAERITGHRPARLAGSNRFATAAVVAAHAHPGGPDVVYATSGFGYPDALAAVSAVVANNGGILLADPRLRWTPDLAAARAYAESRAGSVSFSVVGTDGRRVGYASDTRVPTASVLKVMLMVAYLQQPDVRNRPLTAADRALLEPMITRSENTPATQIADRLGPGPLNDLADRAGMTSFAYTRPWGLSTTSARDQSRFLYDLELHLPERHRAYAKGLLGGIVPEQRWGIGQVATPDWTPYFKGGWGSGTGATDHQVVLLEHASGTRIGLAVMTRNNPSHEYGKETLRGVFSRLLADLP